MPFQIEIGGLAIDGKIGAVEGGRHGKRVIGRHDVSTRITIIKL